ncbi:unnamed protein product [Effrenium voratum]|nr:unnamed protein product [Effrenium voratum]
MLASTTSFTGMAAVSKVIGPRASTEEKLFWRSLLSVCFTLLQNGAAPQLPRHAGLLGLRGLCGHLALLAYLEALERVPLAEAVFLGKVHPVAAAVLSWIFLGEALSLARALSIAASLLGVALIANPSWEALSSGDLVGHLLALLAGTLSGGAYCCVRCLSRSGEAETWTLLALPAVSLPFCAKDAWSGAGHEASTWAWLLALGVSTQLGQVFLVRGLARLPAACGTQAMYFGTLSGVALGSLLGEPLPSLQACGGGAVIVGSLQLAGKFEAVVGRLVVIFMRVNAGTLWHVVAATQSDESPRKRWIAVSEDGQLNEPRLLRSEHVERVVSGHGQIQPASLKERQDRIPCNETQGLCVDCQWADWKDWIACSVSCNGGTQSRTRIIQVQAEGAGQECTGESSETQDCGTATCPVDCEASDWAEWTPCAPYCHGTQNRSRAIQKPAAYGGEGCGVLSEVQSCTNFCMDCQLSPWNGWSTCTRSCGGGTRQRLRSEVYVQRRAPTLSLLETGQQSKAVGYEKKMGVRCDSAHRRTLDAAGETPDEAEAACSADPNCGGLYDQGCNNWLTICDVGLTLEAEEGSCSYMKKEIGDGSPCTGDISQSEECSSQLCPVDCKYSDWAEWTDCFPYCKGTINRTRTITQQPANGGVACGSIAEVQNCTNECVDCKWGSWVAWSECPVSCGGATQTRARDVLVQKAGGGKACEGNSSVTRACADITCPVDCEMDDWSDWTDCTPFCQGTQTRSRSVVVEPLAGGQACGDASNVVNCSNACVDCEVSPWSVWSPCTATCGSGRQTRSRMVLVEAEGEGNTCPESMDGEKEGCNPQNCPVDCVWGDWAPWNGCSVTCCGGMKNRTRGKIAEEKFGGSPCEGEDIEMGSCAEKACPQDCLWSDWETWGNCSKPCGGGEQNRYRFVVRDPLGEGRNCTGRPQDSRGCNEEACAKDCEFLDWEDWSACSVSCGPGGNKTRSRQIDGEVNGGAPCDPAVPLHQSVECGTSGCPRNCQWGDWGGWSNCSKTCGLGLLAGATSRHRVQAVTAAFGGAACEGHAVHTTRCNEQHCPVDCEWKDWTAWTECIQPCGGNGTRQRSRNSTAAKFEGEPCVGESTEVSACTVLGGCSVNCTWEDWNEWTACSATCGEGGRVRFRFVADEAKGPHGIPCAGPPQEDEFCQTGSECPVDCAFNDWKDWGLCEVMPCGPSKKLRSRTKQSARYGGKPCDGNASQEEDCTVPDAKIIECDENGQPVTSTTTTVTFTSTITSTTITNTSTTVTSTETATSTTVTTTAPPSTTTAPDIAVTTVGLTADAAATAVAAAAPVSVRGSQVMEVNDPDTFAKDPSALKALKEAIAQEVGVSMDAVIIKGAKVESQEGQASLLSLGARRAKVRRQSPKGAVNLTFEIVPALNNKTVDEVMDAVDNLDPEEVEETNERALIRNNAKYSVQMGPSETQAISKISGKPVRESQTHSGVQSPATLFALLLVLANCGF